MLHARDQGGFRLVWELSRMQRSRMRMRMGSDKLLGDVEVEVDWT
jgi:hypothetical protein